MTPQIADQTGALDVTWIGHSSFSIDVAGTRILCDPVLTNRIAHLRRRRAAPDPSLFEADIVLVSHAHMDHLHVPSLALLRPGAEVVVPRGLGRLLDPRRFTVTEVVIGQHLERGPVTIEVVPAAHKHGRGPHRRIAARPVGYVVGGDGRRIYFAGDTDLFPQMQELDDIDVALLPIWGWGPTIGVGHLDPARAADATTLIEPRLVIPMHWGTYAPEDGRRRLPRWFDTPPDRFASELGAVGRTDRLRLLEPGSSCRVDD